MKQFDLASMRQLESAEGQAKNAGGNATTSTTDATSTAEAATDADDGKKEESEGEGAEIVHGWLEHDGLLLKNEQTEAWLRQRWQRYLIRLQFAHAVVEKCRKITVKHLLAKKLKIKCANDKKISVRMPKYTQNFISGILTGCKYEQVERH